MLSRLTCESRCPLNLRSRCQHKAWGASPRMECKKKHSEPAKRPTAVTHHRTVARSAGSHAFYFAILGLAPQALCCRPLRGLKPKPKLPPLRGLRPKCPALWCGLLRGLRPQPRVLLHICESKSKTLERHDFVSAKFWERARSSFLEKFMDLDREDRYSKKLLYTSQ